MAGSANQSVVVKNTLYEVMNSCFPAEKGGAATRILALIATNDFGVAKGISTLKQLNGNQTYTRVFAEDAYFESGRVDNFIALSGNDDWNLLHHYLGEIEDQFDELFIPVASFSLVSELIYFLDQRPLSRIIQRALLKGKKVTIVEDNLDPYGQTIQETNMDQGTSFMKKELFNQYKKLQGYGVTLIHSDQVKSYFHKCITGQKRLLSEEAVKRARLNQQHEIIISKGTLVTPLARDTAREFGIQLTIE